MSQSRRTAAIAGSLYFVTHVTSIAAVVLYGGSAFDPFAELGSRTAVLTGGLLEVLLALADPGVRPRLWMDWGRRRDNGFHNEVIEAKAERWTREMITLLRERYGYDLQDLQPGETPRKDAMGWVYEDQLGGHDEDAWSYRFGLLMQAFFPR